MEIRFQTDVGKRRNTNQDFAATYVNKANVTLALLADGMGATGPEMSLAVKQSVRSAPLGNRQS